MRKALIYTGALFLLSVLILYLLTPQNEHSLEDKEKGVSISFLDVGQGDATFIEFSDGSQMLIDCAIDARIMEALGRVMEFHDRSIEYLVLTHPDLDHYGGCQDVLERFDIREIILNGDEKNGDQWRSFMDAVNAEGADITIMKDQFEWDISGTQISFLYPDHDVSENTTIPGATKETGPNNASIIIKISYDGIETLLIGDAEKEQEEYLVEHYMSSIDVEVLKAGHHGSAGSSVQSFVDATSPDEVIFSAGVGNSFGHPSARIIRRFERAGSRIWRTDTMGDILLRVTKGGYYIQDQWYGVESTTTSRSQGGSEEIDSDQG